MVQLVSSPRPEVRWGHGPGWGCLSLRSGRGPGQSETTGVRGQTGVFNRPGRHSPSPGWGVVRLEVTGSVVHREYLCRNTPMYKISVCPDPVGDTDVRDPNEVQSLDGSRSIHRCIGVRSPGEIMIQS